MGTTMSLTSGLSDEEWEELEEGLERGYDEGGLVTECECCGGLPDIFGKCLAGCDDE